MKCNIRVLFENQSRIFRFHKIFIKRKSLSDLPVSEMVVMVLSDMSVYATVIVYFSNMQLRLSSLNLSLCRCII